MMRQFQTIKAVDMKCETCGGPHSFTECPVIGGYTQETAYATTDNYNSGDLKVITTRSGVTLVGPSVSPSSSSKEVNREPETTTDQVLTRSTNNVPPLVVQPSPASTSFSIISSLKMPEVTKDTVLLLQEFDIIIRDKKGTKNLAADHLSRLENPHKDVLENKDINKNFPLETLVKISSESTPWFVDFAN
nr:reverse transcriptase domain-containing protein [Tanacetum cinerariifolium]